MEDLKVLSEVTSRLRGLAGSGERTWASQPEEALMAGLRELAALHRVLDGVMVAAAGEVASRSGATTKEKSLALRLGQRNAFDVIREIFGLAPFNARALVDLGTATRAQGTTDNAGPARPSGRPAGTSERPALAEAFRAGELTIDVARPIHEQLSKNKGAESIHGGTGLAEATLVHQATGGRVNLIERHLPPRPVPGPCSTAPTTVPAAREDTGLTHGFAPGSSPTSSPNRETHATSAASTFYRVPPTAPGAPEWTTPRPLTTHAPAPGNGHGHGLGHEHEPWHQSSYGQPFSDTAPDTGAINTATSRPGPPLGSAVAQGRLSPTQIRRQANDWALALNPNGGQAAHQRQMQRRNLRLTPDHDGGYTITGYAPQLHAAEIRTLLDAYLAPRTKTIPTTDNTTTPKDQQDPPQSTKTSQTQATDDRTHQRKSFDALMTILRTHATSNAAPKQSGQTPTILITTTLTALDAYLTRQAHRYRTDHPTGITPSPSTTSTGTIDGTPETHQSTTNRSSYGTWPTSTAQIPLHDSGIPDLNALIDLRFARIAHDGTPIPLEATSHLICDAALQHFLTTDTGHPLKLGRTQRLFTPAQRRILNTRDKHCQAPGCTIPATWCEAHHITPWHHGGQTNMENGILLCPFHHHQIDTTHPTTNPPPGPGDSTAHAIDHTPSGNRTRHTRRREPHPPPTQETLFAPTG